ncbi:MAG: peptidoglycan editing factor PgeF [Anaerolineae bacterium]|nr:peptidoglycan editing factor PgeF [Anaerolineae bacterium]
MNSLLPPVERCQSAGLTWYRFPQIMDGVEHALLTRLGGVSRGHLAALNLGSTVGDDPAAVAENYRRVFAAFGLRREAVVTPFQVHGNHVVRVGPEAGGSVIQETDALITDALGVAVLMRFADCAPVLFFDPVRHAVGLAHAGWRGVAAGVVVATVRAMQASFGTHPEDLWAGIGPAIGPRHYAVGAEVLAAIEAAVPPQTVFAERRENQAFLDLPAAITAQLHAAGVMTVIPSQLDTAARTDEWYSHRAEHGRTGRFGVLMCLRQ